jgi:hypothetical protein
MDLSQSRIPRVVLSLAAAVAVAAVASCGSEGATDGQVLGPAAAEATEHRNDDGAKPDGDGGKKDDGKRHDDGEFHARLCGYEETPAVSTSGSGTFFAKVDKDQIWFKLTYRDLEAPVTVAHIHFGQPGVAGGVSAFLCGGGGKPACPPPPAEIEGTVVADDVVGPAAQGIAAGELDELLHALRNGLTYANVHSEMFTAGEVRGQIVGGHDDHGDAHGHDHAKADDHGRDHAGGCSAHHCLPCQHVKPPDGKKDGGAPNGPAPNGPGPNGPGPKDDHGHDGPPTST